MAMPAGGKSFLLHGAAVALIGVTLATGIAAIGAPKAEEKQVPPEVGIPFVNRGGIVDWEVVDDSTLLLRDRHGQWYRASLQVPAYTLSYADRLRFVTGPSGTLEKFGAVVIRGQRYPIVSLIRTDPPQRARR